MAKEKTKACFLTCDNGTEQLEPIVFNVPATYGAKVKIYDWQMQTLAEPRDNTEIFPPKGNLHLASYRRIGPDHDSTWTSETQAMLAQIELKDQYKPIYAQRSLLNMHSFAYTESEEDEKDLKLADIILDPVEIRCMDYRTTMDVDYRLPYPMKPKPPPPPPAPEPWMLNRRCIGYGLRELENRYGVNTFLDDNMDVHKKVAEVKQRRKMLYEGALPRENDHSTTCTKVVSSKAAKTQ